MARYTDGVPRASAGLIMSRMVKIAKISDLKPGCGNVFETDSGSIALFNVSGVFYALDNTCSHRGGSLGEGKLKGDIVTCPLHGAHFNVKTGAVTFPPARFGVRSFAVKVEGNDVLVELD